MHPELIRLGPLTIHSYGTLIVLGFLAGLFLIKLRAKKFQINYEKCVDLSFGLLLSGFAGAKLFHWLIIPSGFIRDMKLLFSEPLEFIKSLGNGFEFFGGIAIGVIFFLWFTRKQSLPRLKVMDLIVPSIPLAHAFGRMGCFMAGCCYGKECHQPWSVVFTDANSLAPRHIPLHPTQLYESLLLVVLTSILLISEKRITRIEGRMVSFYIIGYTFIRFFVEYFRGDDRGSIPGIHLTGTQIIAILIAAGAVAWLMVLQRRHRKESSIAERA